MSTGSDALMEWLRVQMLRLRSFDWGPGSRSIHSLRDGVAKFSAHYTIQGLCSHLGVSEDEILSFIDSPPALEEMEGRSFTASWTGNGLTLSWLEEGIREWNTDISVEYSERDGSYFVSSRWRDKIVYLDGAERTVTDSGLGEPTEISKARLLSERQKIENQAAS